MYYNQSPTIIEPNDITALRSSQVETGADGVTIATLVVELNTSKKGYVPFPALFLTDGVSPRLLAPQQQEASSPDDGATAVDLSASEPASPGGKKSRMSRDERGEGA